MTAITLRSIALSAALVAASQFVAAIEALTSKDRMVLDLMGENVKIYKELQLLSGDEDAIKTLAEEDIGELIERLKYSLYVAEHVESSIRPPFWSYIFITVVLLLVSALVIYEFRPKKLPRGQEYVTPNDKIWSMECPKNPMYITSLNVLERTTIENIKTVVLQSIESNDRAKMKLVRRGSGLSYDPIWEEDKKFHIDRHVFAAPLGEDGNAVTRAELEKFISKVSMDPFPIDRPPWVYYFVENYENNQSAMVFRIDHTVADGVALIASTFQLMKPVNPDDAIIGQTKVGQQSSNNLKMLLYLLLWYTPYSTIKKFLWKKDGIFLKNKKLSGVRHVAWSNGIPLDDVKAVKNSMKCTVNDILMSCVAGAFQRYLKQHQSLTESDFEKMTLRAVVPVNVRSAKQMQKIKFENFFSTVLVPLALNKIDPRERLAETKRSMDALKKQPEAQANFVVINIITKLPLMLTKFLMDFIANKASMVLTNVPGMPYPVKFGEARVNCSTFWVPSSGDLGVGVSILSFADEVRLGVTLDEAVGKDPHEIIQAFEADFAQYKSMI